MTQAPRLPRVLITDETLRDGLQIEREGITVEEKIGLLDMLVDAGLKRLVVGAFVNPKWSPQMADTAELVGRLRPREGVQYLALALNERGRERRRELSPPLSVEPMPATHLHLCPHFLLRNTNTTLEQQEARWRAPIERAAAGGTRHAAIGLSAPWGSNWSGAFTREQRMAALRRQYDAWTQAGIEVRRVDLADPMAWNTPQAVEQDVRAILEAFPSITDFHLHLHNARGMALLSAYQALRLLDERHVLILDAAVGGIGGCPYCGNGQATGMIPTEDLVQLLEVCGVDTGIDLARLIEASYRLQDLVGRPLNSQVARCGPLPTRQDLRYDPEMPAVYTLREAQHFRLGPSVYEGNARPWKRDAAAAPRQEGAPS